MHEVGLLFQLVKEQDGIDHGAGFLGGVLGMRCHGNLAPLANAALEHFVRQFFWSRLVVAVAFGDLEERRGHQRARPLMAVEAVALGDKLEATLGERGFLHVARGLFQTMDERLRNGTLDGAFVFDSHEGTLIILGVVQHVQAALRSELEVGGLT